MSNWNEKCLYAERDSGDEKQRSQTVKMAFSYVPR